MLGWMLWCLDKVLLRKEKLTAQHPISLSCLEGSSLSMQLKRQSAPIVFTLLPRGYMTHAAALSDLY